MIVGLDSPDDGANYIHIDDVRDNIEYYCPCCKGKIKPRAYKKNTDYKIQPHFYHENGGCSEETFVHYICKNWLFEKGCKFIVKNIEYEVDSIEIGKTLSTSFGDYRPDIIVNTTSGKTFYFEIRSTNKKTEHYIPKWDELGNNVVEVDTRYFINQKCKSDIPEFELIYSDGECFIKSYSQKDYDESIAKKKLEWKRQDKLNYKIQWERLDWFWNEMQQYKQNEKTLNDVFECFKVLDISDKEMCFDLLKRQQCIKSNNQRFRDIINNECIEFWNKNAEKLIGNNIEFKRVRLKPRNEIQICFSYVNILDNVETIPIYFENREWIIRFSLLSKIINSIKLKIKNENVYLLNVQEYEKFVDKAMKNILKKFKKENCVWYLEKRDRYYFTVGIRNAKSFFYYEHFSIPQYNDCYDEGALHVDDMNYNKIYNSCIEIVEKNMRIVQKEVLKRDGINSMFRNIFVDSSEVLNDK